MLNRREFLALAGAAAGGLVVRSARGQAPQATQPPPAAGGVFVNDVHSRLNLTRVTRIESVEDLDGLCAAIQRAARAERCVSVCGGRHAMGGQQFATDSDLIDMSAMNRMIALDDERGD